MRATNFYFSALILDLIISIGSLTSSIFRPIDLEWFVFLTQVSIGVNTVVFALSMIMLIFTNKMANKQKFNNVIFKIFFLFRILLALLILMFALFFTIYYLYKLNMGESLNVGTNIWVLVIQFFRFEIYLFQLCYVLNFRKLFFKKD